MNKIRRTIATLGAAGLLASGIGIVAAAPASANTTCTYTIGWYKNHTSFPSGSVGADLTAGLTEGILARTGLPTLQAVLDAPAKGDPVLIAAKQLIAAASNGSPGDSGFTGPVGDAFYSLAYFFTTPTATASRESLLADKDVLDAYNNGLLGLPHCA